MTDMMHEFLVETNEGLDMIDRHLIALEEHPDDAQLLTEVFRAVHTVKSSCGFYGLDRLERVAHSAENLLALLRDRTLTFNPTIADSLLAMIDTIRSMLPHIDQEGHEGPIEIEHVVAMLDAAAEETGWPGPDPDERDDHHDNDQGDDERDDHQGLGDLAGSPNQGRGVGSTERIGDALVTAGHAKREDVELAAVEQALGDPRRIGDILVDGGRVQRPAVETTAAQLRSNSALADSTIRVDVGLLDRLMNLVGELVLSRNEMVRLAGDHDDHVFGPSAQRLSLITSELQEGIMKTRMQPINSAWARLPRVVRDLSHHLGKRVKVEMIGRETELDRTIIEAIKDPLTHIVRNTVDHGIEIPEVREAAGKPAQGTLTLSASHEGEQVNIEISDDGSGIDIDRVLAKAVDRGLVSPAKAETMTHSEIVHLIFQPGFSTAEQVTNVSGRGVGMDVVKANVERIGGTVDVRTEVGEGTTFAIKIPLTLAIIPALTVRSGEGSYAIPQVNVLELVRLRANGEERIEDLHGAPVFRLRGKLLPIVDLREQLGLPPSEQKTTNIAVVKADSLRFGLVVDGIDDNGEIVVKPLGQQVKDLRLFSGATIMGDGRVALILDLLGTAEQAGLLSTGPASKNADGDLDSDELDDHRSLDTDAMIVLSLGDGERVAVGLPEIDRLEEVPADAIERSDGRPVIQYRGTVMPLIDVGQVIGVGGSVLTTHQHINVVVCIFGGQTVGLAVDQILDIVHSDGITPTGTEGTVVIDGQVTDLISPETIIAAALPSLHRTVSAGEAPSPGEAWVGEGALV